MSRRHPQKPPSQYSRPSPPPAPPKVQTMYNVKINEKKDTKPNNEPQKITLLREAHVTELTLGNQTLRVMDAGHIQGVINMIEKQDFSIKQLNKTVNAQTRTIVSLSQQINNLQTEVDELKRKLNGNYL